MSNSRWLCNDAEKRKNRLWARIRSKNPNPTIANATKIFVMWYLL